MVGSDLPRKFQFGKISEGDSPNVVANVRNCCIVVCEFEFQLSYFIYYKNNTCAKGMNPLILTVMG